MIFLPSARSGRSASSLAQWIRIGSISAILIPGCRECTRDTAAGHLASAKVPSACSKSSRYFRSTISPQLSRQTTRVRSCSVSYTHLDVYKRQGMWWCRCCKKSGCEKYTIVNSRFPRLSLGAFLCHGKKYK